MALMKWNGAILKRFGRIANSKDCCCCPCDYSAGAPVLYVEVQYQDSITFDHDRFVQQVPIQCSPIGPFLETTWFADQTVITGYSQLTGTYLLDVIELIDDPLNTGCKIARLNPAYYPCDPLGPNQSCRIELNDIDLTVTATGFSRQDNSPLQCQYTTSHKLELVIGFFDFLPVTPSVDSVQFVAVINGMDITSQTIGVCAPDGIGFNMPAQQCGSESLAPTNSTCLRWV